MTFHKTGHTADGLGLASLCKAVLGFDLCKDVAVRCSNWAAPLTSEQIYYASCDAHVAQRILERLHHHDIMATASSSLNDTVTPSLQEWCQAFKDCAVGAEQRSKIRSASARQEIQAVEGIKHEFNTVIDNVVD